MSQSVFGKSCRPGGPPGLPGDGDRAGLPPVRCGRPTARHASMNLTFQTRSQSADDLYGMRMPGVRELKSFVFRVTRMHPSCWAVAQITASGSFRR